MAKSNEQEEVRIEPSEPNNYRVKLVKFLKTLNLFESESNDIETVHREHWSTRLYILLLISFMVGLFLYAALLLRTVTVTVSKPTEQQFEELHSRQRDTINCPCSRVAIQYVDFVHFDARVHEVCKSHFISQAYIDAIYGANVSFIPPTDIRTTISAFWQLIRSFCDIATDTLTHAYNAFNATIFLSPRAQPPLLVEVTLEASWNTALTSALANMKQNLLIDHEMTVSNGFLSGLATNYHYDLHQRWNDSYGDIIKPVTNHFADGCSCSNLNGCLQHTEIPGMVVNCLPLDGTLESSLECFYEPWCLSLIQQELPNDIKAPLLRSPSRFSHNVTLRALLYELMLEELTTNVRFADYYSQCNPNYCVYSYSRRFDVLYIITLVASAYGVMSIILSLIASFTIKLVFMIRGWKVKRNSVGIAHNRPPISLRKLYHRERISPRRYTDFHCRSNCTHHASFIISQGLQCSG